MKSEIGDWLPRLLKSRLSDLVDEDTPFPGEQYPDHGILGRRPRKEIVRIALDDVVLPGFAQAGIDPTKAAEWVKSAFAAR
jgi:hypothetical protein